MKKILLVARSEYLCWIMQPKMLVVGVLMIFTRSLAVEPLMARAIKMGIPMNSFEPFVAVGNSGQLVMLIPFVFLILLSDYPKMSSNSLLVISRTGKRSWFWGQMLFLCLAILTYLSLILLGSILVSGANWSSPEWSDAVTKYDSMFPEEYGSFASTLLPSNLYNQIPLMRAVFLTFGYLFLYLLLLSVILYLFRFLHMSSVGLLAVVFVISCGVFTCALRTRLMWAFPMAHTIAWLHYDEILKKPVVPIYLTNGYWSLAIISVISGSRLALQRYTFSDLDTRR